MFEQRRTGLPWDASEALEAIGEAAHNVIDALVLKVFGAGSGTRVRVALVARSVTVDAGRFDAAAQAMMGELETLPATAFLRLNPALGDDRRAMQ